MIDCARYTWIRIAIVYVAAFISTSTATTGKFWHYTDPHADFSYITEGYSCIKHIPDRSPIGDYHCDPPWSLVQSSINAMKEIEPNVDFVIWTGDNVLHAGTLGEDGFLNTVINQDILDNITSMLKSAFRDIPVYPAFGNHDYYPDAQFPATPDPIYHHLRPSWYRWVRDPQFNATFNKGGYYAINLSLHLKLVSLNTILNDLRNQKVKGMTDPADQFSWFESQLEDARMTGRKVYVIGHIGMGVVKALGSLWLYDEHHARYLALMEEYKDVLAAMFFGHDHASLFKIFHDSNGEPKVPLLFAASVTPWILDLPHNPAIGLLTYEKETGRVLEISQYYLDLPKAIKTGVLRWEKLYDFSTLYDTIDLGAHSLATLADRFRNETLLRNFLRLSLVDATDVPCDQACLVKYRCGILHLDMAGYERCVSVGTDGFDKMSLMIGLVTGIVLFIAVITLTLYANKRILSRKRGVKAKIPYEPI